MERMAEGSCDPVGTTAKLGWIKPEIVSLHASEAAVPKFNAPEGGSGSIDLAP